MELQLWRVEMEPPEQWRKLRGDVGSSQPACLPEQQEEAEPQMPGPLHLCITLWVLWRTVTLAVCGWSRTWQRELDAVCSPHFVKLGCMLSLEKNQAVHLGLLHTTLGQSDPCSRVCVCVGSRIPMGLSCWGETKEVHKTDRWEPLPLWLALEHNW